MDNKSEVVGRESLSTSVWLAAPGERALDPHIASLRKKLQKTAVELKTVYGVGNKVVVNATNGLAG